MLYLIYALYRQAACRISTFSVEILLFHVLAVLSVVENVTLPCFVCETVIQYLVLRLRLFGAVPLPSSYGVQLTAQQSGAEGENVWSCTSTACILLRAAEGNDIRKLLAGSGFIDPHF